MIQVIERFDRIMHYVANHPERPCRVKEFAELLEVSQPTCSNIVRTMLQLNYLEQARDGGYIMGPCPSLLVRHGAYKEYLVKLAEPLVENLVGRINENCLVTTHSNSKRVVLFYKNSTRSLQSGNTDVITTQLMTTATGIIMLAYMSEQELESYSSQNPFVGSVLEGVNGWPGLKSRLPEIRAEKCCWHVSGDRLDQRAAIAVPILSGDRLEAVLGCWIPGLRFTGNNRRHLMEECKKTAAMISQQLNDINTKY